MEQRGRGAPAPARKMRIRAYPRKPAAPPQLLHNAWQRYLRPAIDAVHQSQRVPHSLELLYGQVHDIVLHRNAPALYDALRAACDAHIAKRVAHLAALPPSSEHVFLAAVHDVWHTYCTHMLRIRQIFLYLDRTYIVHAAHPDARSFWDMALLLFRTHFSSVPVVQHNTVHCLLTLIDRDRDGDAVDVALMKNISLMFTAIGTYDTAFEKLFLAATDFYYRNESTKLVASQDVPTYLKHAETRIQAESHRAFRILHSRTRNPLISTVEKRLVSDHVVTLLDNGFSSMCDQHRKHDLKRCFAVLSRASDHMPADSRAPNELMKSRLIDYVKKVGRAIVMDRSKDPEMVQSLLSLKARLDDLVTFSFDGTEAFNMAVNFAFESFVNARENKPAELIAKFVDSILRTGNKGFSEEQLETTLDNALTLFRFIDGKDVFEAFYNKDLAKRLLYDKSASLDLEKSMISKLKHECGPQFTSKLEAMFRDVDASKDLMQSFKTHKLSKASLSHGIDLNVYVLESARWPLSTQPSKVKLPQSLMDCQEVFKKFYLTKHSGRKLAWQHVNGSCRVKANFPEGTKFLELSLYQTIVMVLFNDADQLSYSEIADATGIEELPLKRTMLSLACGKARVLLKRPKGPQVNTTDSFIFNKRFTHRQTKLKINAIQIKETVEENAATTERVFQERNYQIDAAVVRIMKTRRTLQHAGLLAEVFDQLRFHHKPADVKKRIESLIEREYLERDENNPQTYHYLA